MVSTCGHDCCELCFRRWTVDQGRRSCPVCRAAMPGGPADPLPRVCLRLQHTLEQLFPEVGAGPRTVCRSLSRWPLAGPAAGCAGPHTLPPCLQPNPLPKPLLRPHSLPPQRIKERQAEVAEQKRQLAEERRAQEAAARREAAARQAAMADQDRILQVGVRVCSLLCCHVA